jgi:peroxiredoxin Q/BCP
MTYKLNIGDEIPRFKGKDQDGNEYTEEDVIGGPLVIYFYPKDNTANCTNQACSFRDNMEALDDLDCIIIGVSPDSAESHNKFIQDHNLNYALFTDENKELAKKFDVLRENDKIERTTFVVDPLGMITWIERPVTVEGHTERVIEAVQEILSQNE